MLKRFFVTGTDTSVGKTVVSRALLQALAASGKRVAGYKPVAKGSKETPEGLRNKDALVLQSVSSLELPYHAVNPIALSEEESSVAHSGLINYPLLSDGLANLNWTSDAFADGLTVKALLRVRNTGGGPGDTDLDSASSAIDSCVSETDGPDAIEIPGMQWGSVASQNLQGVV